MSSAEGPPPTPELPALRVRIGDAEQRIKRAQHQLQLAAELEQRLQALLAAPKLPKDLLPPSPLRPGAEVEATQILLDAELRAAAILNATGGPRPAPDESRELQAAAVGPEAARALTAHLQALAEIEKGLVEIGRLATQLEDSGGPFAALPPADDAQPPARRRTGTKAAPRSTGRTPPRRTE